MVFQEHETVDLTAVIRGILDNYPAGSAVLREFLQNSDDAGARSQEFILDTRSFPRQPLVDQSLAYCQGPALLAINDGLFKDKDWTALTHIRRSSKTADETSTGKYGLGFRSCYHVTDNPHILSGKKLLVLDPHDRVEEFQGGFSLRLDSDDRRQYRGHFLTFQSVLDDNDKSYNGTAIRLPLRLRDEARRSKIKSVATSVENMRTTLEDFVEKELREVLLFLRNITSIGLFEVEPNGVKKLIARAWIDNADDVAECRGMSRGRTEESSTYELRIKVDHRGSVTSRTWILTQFVGNYGRAEKIVADRCPVAPRGLMASEKLVPHVALAYPVPDTRTSGENLGKLFTLLPLPIDTRFPFHIHAMFALNSNRQSLKNPHDVATGSREEFLVEWNRAIFRYFVPEAWEVLLQYVVKRVVDPINSYDLWPRGSTLDQDYWRGLPQELLKRGALKQFWPLLTQGVSPTKYRSLADVLLAPTDAKADLLGVLASLSVMISQPPEHVYSLVESSQAYRPRIMAPSSVMNVIKSIPRLTAMPPASLSTLCDYISTGNDISLLSHAPLIPSADGTRTSLNLRNVYILVTKAEADLFHPIDPQARFLDLDVIGQVTRDLLLSSNRVRRLQRADVVHFLELKFSKFQSDLATVSKGVGAAEIDWLVQFWNWIGDWVEAPGIWAKLGKLHIIPLSDHGWGHNLRLFADGCIDIVGLDQDLLEVFRQLQLPILNSRIKSPRSSELQQGLRLPSDLNYILSELSGSQPLTLSQPNSRRLRDHFVTNLPALGGQQLQPNEKATLLQLPIYPVLRAGPRVTGEYTFEAIRDSPCFVDDALEVVPSIQGRPIIAISECRSIVNVAYGGDVEVKRESEVLGLAVQCWEEQDKDLALLLVGRIINRLGDLSADTLKLVERLPIVDVGLGLTRLRRPIGTVDPNSDIAKLFDDGEGVFPRGLFAPDGHGSYLKLLRNHGLLLDQLSPEVVIERIERIVDSGPPLPGKDAKANALLQLLDKYCERETLPKGVVAAVAAQPWLLAGNTYCSSSKSWDKRRSDLPLCDRILPSVNYVVSSTYLRKVLGWQTLPFDILRRQLLAVVSDGAIPPGSKKEGIINLIQALARCLDIKSCTESELESLGHTLGDRSWVPVASEHSLPLHRTTLQPIDLGLRIQQVLPSLLTDPLVTRVLRLIGVPSRPSYELLYTEIAEISCQLEQHRLEEQERKVLVSTSINFLRELFERDGLDSHGRLDRSRIQVPTTKSLLRPIDSTVFNDIELEHPDSNKIYLAHPDITWSFANTLRLLRLSDKQFEAEDDFFKDRQLSEDYCARVQEVLEGYRVESASSEWVASADAARATKIGFMIDEMPFERSQRSRFLSPQSAELCQGPALVIWNNGTFPEKDYESVLSSGGGGLGKDSETIERFRLGLLPFYHFTEMIMMVSGKRVMFLDPSGSYLPRNAHGDLRTALLLSLKTCRSKYPGHLQPLEGLFEFSHTEANYEGTLFRLPLRMPQQALNSKLLNTAFDTMGLHTHMKTTFHDQAKGSLFFTRVEEISAYWRSSRTALPMWSIQGNRESPVEAVDGYHLEMSLEIRFKESQPEKQDWLIHFAKIQHSDVPGMFSHLIRKHGLPPPSIGLAMRINHDVPTTTPTRSQIFATLPLPVEIALPVHVHATWILTEDRQTIRFDARDSDGEWPMDTRYNIYLMENLIPEVYLRMLATLARRDSQAWRQCWPGTEVEEVIRRMVPALYKQLVKTTHCVCRTVTGAVVTPAAAIFATSSSRHVQAVLEALKPPKLVSPLPFDMAMMLSWEGLRTDDAGTVTELLHHHAEAVRKLFCSRSSQPSMLREHLDGVIKYLVEEEQELNGLPLLQLGDGDITTFGDSTHPWIFQDATCSLGGSTSVPIATLFGPKNVVGTAITNRTCELLIGKVGNVRNLDADGIRQLLVSLGLTPSEEATVTTERKAWLPTLLQSLALWPTPKLRDIADLPLIPVMNGNIAISLNKACDGTVFDILSLGNLYLPIKHIGILVTPSLPDVTPEPGLDLVRLLKAFRSLELDVGTLNQRVSAPECLSLRQWITQNLLPSRWSQVDRDTLLTIPIFEAQNGGPNLSSSLCPASEIHMLPEEVQLETVTRYLPEATFFADYSFELGLVLEGRSQQVLSREKLVKYLELPTTVSSDEDCYFQRVLEVIASQRRWGVVAIPFVPNMDRNLRRPEELYDHRVRPFAVAFSTRHAMFVHPKYRNDIGSLVQAGVRTEIDASTLIQCVMALDEDAREGVLDQTRAAEFWTSFADDDALRTVSLDAIVGLRFIPYPRERRGMEKFEEFAQPLPHREIASLNELVRMDFVPVVWTQRARFGTPTENFIFTINPSLCVPTVEEVVKHLEVLTAEVAPKFPSDPSLLDDLTETYNWLLDHIEDAGMFLEQRETSLLWLNVNDPRDGVTTWTWRSGRQLIFNLGFDDPEGDHYGVNIFLLRYKDLLMAAGADEQTQLTIPAFEHEMRHDERLCRGWESLRQNDLLTDIQFEVNGEIIKAHQELLIAAIPHFRDALVGPFHGGERGISTESPMVFPTNGITSTFAIQSVIDYAYEGSCTRPPCNTIEEAGLALHELLALLELSHLWGIEDLRNQTEKAIVELDLVRRDTCEEILGRAVLCGAIALADACHQRQQDVNRWASAHN